MEGDNFDKEGDLIVPGKIKYKKKNGSIIYKNDPESSIHNSVIQMLDGTKKLV